MNSANQDAYYAGDFIEDDSFLILTQGDMAELRALHGASSIGKTNHVEPASQSNSASLAHGGNAADSIGSSAPKALPRSSVGVGTSGSSENGDQGLSEPVSSYFQNSMDPYNAAPSRNSVPTSLAKDRETIGNINTTLTSPHDVSLAAVFSSMGSISSSEANSLEVALDLVNTLKRENEELKEALAQRNEVMRDRLKSLQTSVVTVESKHADQLRMYDDCKKSIAELRAENERLKEELEATEQAKVPAIEIGFEKLETLETSLNAKEAEVIALENQIGELSVYVKALESQITTLKEQQKEGQAGNALVMQEKDVLQFDLTDARISIAHLIEEQKKCSEELAFLRKLQQQKLCDDEANEDNVKQLKSALGETRLHLTRQKECIEDKDKVISSLQTKVQTLMAENEQKNFLATQLREFESNFKEERSDKIKLAEELSLLKIDLDKKTTELDKLHQTHLVLANEHLNRKDGRTAVAPSAPDEFVFVARQNPNQIVRQEQVQSNPPSYASYVSSSPLPSLGAAASIPLPPVVQRTMDAPQGLQPCPLCQKRFATIEALSHHASNCGIESGSRGNNYNPTNPFIFP